MSRDSEIYAQILADLERIAAFATRDAVAAGGWAQCPESGRLIAILLSVCGAGHSRGPDLVEMSDATAAIGARFLARYGRSA